jgi:nitroreductase
MKYLEEHAAQWLKNEKPESARNFIHGWNQGKEMVLRGAPHLIVAMAREEYPWGQTDCAIALSYVELAAKAQGLGTCWAGVLTMAVGANRSISEFLGVPNGYRVYGALMLGYPVYSYDWIPMRNGTVIKWA